MRAFLIFKQLFFPNFRAIREPKFIYHYIWLGEEDRGKTAEQFCLYAGNILALQQDLISH